MESQEEFVCDEEKVVDGKKIEDVGGWNWIT